MIATLIRFKNVFAVGMGVIFFIFVCYIFYQNKGLKIEISKQNEVINSQKASLSLWQEKQKQALISIEVKEKELIRIKNERLKNEQEFNQKASDKYHQWRNGSLPDDIINRLQ